MESAVESLARQVKAIAEILLDRKIADTEELSDVADQLERLSREHRGGNNVFIRQIRDIIATS